MNRWQFSQQFGREDLESLPSDEIRKLLPVGREAVAYGDIMGGCTLTALIVAFIGFVFNERGIVAFGAACVIGFIVVGIIGAEVRWARFRRLTAEAILRHRNGTP